MLLAVAGHCGEREQQQRCMKVGPRVSPAQSCRPPGRTALLCASGSSSVSMAAGPRELSRIKAGKENRDCARGSERETPPKPQPKRSADGVGSPAAGRPVGSSTSTPGINWRTVSRGCGWCSAHNRTPENSPASRSVGTHVWRKPSHRARPIRAGPQGPSRGTRPRILLNAEFAPHGPTGHGSSELANKRD
jgi:hypothetical protein